MKQFFPLLLLLALPAAVLARDEGGDGAYIPSRAELARDGYYVHHSDTYAYYNAIPESASAKPTQAYYTKGSTIYYGFVPYSPHGYYAARTPYAFGYPIDFYQQMVAGSRDAAGLNHLVVALNHPSPHSATTQVAATAQSHPAHPGVTTVSRTQGSPLPPVAEKTGQ